jgi:hypothetical protein
MDMADDVDLSMPMEVALHLCSQVDELENYE